jgi:hypothetical protein
MLVTLAIVYCLLSNPTKCINELPVPDDAMTGLAACALQGQQYAVSWLAEHPKYFLDRVRCTPGTPARSDDI